MRTILMNAKIYVEKANFQEAMLIEDGIIIEIGTNEIILKNEADKVIDFKGKTVIPGLNDSHMHLAMVGEAMSCCNLTTAKSIDDIIILGKKFLDENQKIKGLAGKGWNQDYFETGEKRMITRHDLDKISTEIPIVFDRVCVHVSVGNTKALEILGVNENTIVDGGEILLGNDGKPNGIFTENATALIKSSLPIKSNEDIEKEMIKAADYAVSVGITSVQSNDASSSKYQTMFDIIHNIYENKKIKLRYNPQFNFQNIKDFENYLETEHIEGKYDGKFLTKGALKLFKDGSLGARTALMLKDYTDEPGTKGVAALSDEQLQNLCNLAVKNNIRVITHAIGDGAIDSVINAYENTMDGNGNPLRHGIVHCQITSAEQLKRIAKSDLLVMFQPIFLDCDIQVVESRVGKELASTSYAFKTLKELGTKTSFGTDSPVENCNPFPNIYCAVTRQRLNCTPDGGYTPNEKMSVEDAIDAYTIGSAYNEFTEDFKGRLKPGYVADLTVLDKDIFTIDQNLIKDITVVMTMIDGEIVFER